MPVSHGPAGGARARRADELARPIASALTLPPQLLKDFVFDPANQIEQSVFWQGAQRSYIEIMWQQHRIWGVTGAIIANLSKRIAW